MRLARMCAVSLRHDASQLDILRLHTYVYLKYLPCDAVLLALIIAAGAPISPMLGLDFHNAGFVLELAHWARPHPTMQLPRYALYLHFPSHPHLPDPLQIPDHTVGDFRSFAPANRLKAPISIA
jgi:hypothetical protein